jgi:adenine-specific DNA-methyltransferase
VRKVSLRGPKGTAKLDGESYTLGGQIQYTDIWANDNYLQFMYERLLLLKELLSPRGVIWLHCDWNRSHFLRQLMDEVFGADSILNEIVWQRISAHPDSTFFGHVHDTLYFYAKNPAEVVFNKIHTPYSEDFIQRYFTRDDGDGRGLY